MRSFMKLIFHAGGNRAWGQLIAATLIGALVPLLTLRSGQHAPAGSLPAMMLGFGVTGFIVGSGLIFKDVATFKIQQKQEAGLPARGWKFLLTTSLIFVVLVAVLALCLIGSMAFA